MIEIDSSPDIDIRVNERRVLKFVKLPWTEWMLTLGFGLAAAALFCLVYYELIEGL